MSTRLQPRVPDDDRPTAEGRLVTLSMPIDVRSKSLAIMAAITLIVFLKCAQAVLIPIALAVLLSYALRPVVDWLKRNAKLHKAVGAALTLALILGGLGIGIGSLKPEALDILDLVPLATQKLSTALRGNPRTPPGAVAKIQKAATEIEKVANTAPTPDGPIASTKPASEAPGLRIRDYILMGTASVAAGLGQLVVVVVLVYFLLIAGDTFRRTLLRISGDTLSKKKITVQLRDEIDGQIQRYLLVQIATSALLGVVAWLVFTWIGLDNALTWACIGGVLHLIIPYAGPAAFVALIALVAYVQFDTLQPVVVILASVLPSLGVIALLLVPWLTQKVGSLNAVTVFVSLLVWGWLWGVWGLLLGIPIMMAIEAVCDRVESLQPISAFLGHGPPKIETDDSQQPRVAS